VIGDLRAVISETLISDRPNQKLITEF